MSPDDPRHGTYAGAVAHWFDNEKPCADCTRAEWRYRKTRQMRHLRGDPPMVSSVGTVRRIHALLAIGWTGPQIAAEAGVSINAMRSIDYHGSTTVRSTTAAKIAAAYERMSMTWPEGHYASRTRNTAKRRGWLPPLAWDDIDDPDECPDLTEHRRTAADLLAEVDHLTGLGVSIHTAATQLGVTVGAIEKALERARKEAAA